jgi:transcriptional regulator with XRE-family HTH domain
MQSAGPGLMAKKQAKPSEPAPLDPIHDRLKRLIDARRGDRSDADIAREAKLSPSYFSQVKTGYIDNPRIKTVLQILNALGASLSDLDQA